MVGLSSPLTLLVLHPLIELLPCHHFQHSGQGQGFDQFARDHSWINLGGEMEDLVFMWGLSEMGETIDLSPLMRAF